MGIINIIWGLILFLSVFVYADYDYIIVGSGAAGSVLANRLSASGAFSVLVLEAGPDDTAFPNKPVFIEDQFRVIADDPDIGWGYEAFTLGRPLKNFPIQTAKIAGGCTSHNAAMWVQAGSYDWNNWANTVGDQMWNWTNIQGAWKSLENYVSGTAGDGRGRSGPMIVQQSENLQPFANVVLSTASHLGIPTPVDYNTGSREGVNVVQMNSINNTRFSAYTRFLRPFLGVRSNLEIRFNAQVDKVIFQFNWLSLKYTTTGVRYVNSDGTKQTVNLKPNGEVLLAAGSIGTPQILILSGVGPLLQLASLGITPISTLSGVGNNFQDHVSYPVLYEAAQPFAPTIEWTQVMGFKTLTPNPQGIPDLQFFMYAREGGLNPPLLDFGGLLNVSLISPSNQAVCMPVLLHPQARGSISVTSTNVAVKPTIISNFLTNDADVQKLTAGLDWCRGIFRSAEFQSHFPSIEITPLLDGALSVPIWKFLAQTVWHPVGTAKMGATGDSSRVVDSNLRVDGVKGLRVVDASVLPSLPSGNTQVPVMTIAAKIAAKILADRGAN